MRARLALEHGQDTAWNRSIEAVAASGSDSDRSSGEPATAALEFAMFLGSWPRR